MDCGKLPLLSAGDVTWWILLKIWAAQNRHLMPRPDLLFLRDDQSKKCPQFKTLVLNLVCISLHAISDPNSWSLNIGTSIVEVRLASRGVQIVRTAQRDVSRKNSKGLEYGVIPPLSLVSLFLLIFFPLFYFSPLSPILTPWTGYILPVPVRLLPRPSRSMHFTGHGEIMRPRD